MRRLFIIFLSLTLIVKFSFSQEFKNNLVFTNKLHIGQTIKIKSKDLSEGSISINEFSVGFDTKGKKKWHERYLYPEISLSILSGYLGNKILGNTIGIAPAFSLNILDSRDLKIKIKYGSGFAYFNNPYDSISNPQNLQVGTHITNMTIASFIYQIKLSQKWDMALGFSAIHASNGHYQIPNKGLNIISGSFGFKYYPYGDTKRFKYNDNFPNRSKKVKLNIGFGIGRHEFAATTFPIGTDKYTIYRASLFLSKRVSSFNNLLFGINGKYYTDYFHEISKNQIFSENLKLKSSIFTIFIGNEFFIERLSPAILIGYNFYKPFREYYIKTTKQESSQNKMLINLTFDLNIRYFIYNPNDLPKINYYISVSLRTFYGTADFPELGFGIQF